MRARSRALYGNLLRLGFRLLYQEMAWSYDAVSWLVSFGAWQDWQRAALPYIKGPNVLEIGHGPGHMLLALDQAGFDVTGVDLSPQMACLSRRRLRDGGATVPLLRAMAQHLPFRARAFDSVLATFPTEYIVARETLAAVHRVLGDNGRLVIVPFARLSGQSMPVRFVEWLYRITGQRPQGQMLDSSPSPVAQPTLWEQTKGRFQQAGFDATIETVTLSNSEVTIMIVTKEAADSIE